MPLFPAFADIRAGRLFAHGVELQLAHQTPRRLVLGGSWRLDAQPIGLARNRVIGTVGLLGMTQRPRRYNPTRITHRLEVDGPPISVKHALVHHLRQGRVREDGADQLGLGRLQGLGDRVALDQLGHLGADHVRAQELTGLAVEDRLDHPPRLADRARLAIADKREMAGFALVAGISGALFGEADTGDLRTAIGAGRDIVEIKRMHIVDPGDPLYANDSLMARLVSEPRRSDEITDRVDTGLAGAQPLVHY